MSLGFHDRSPRPGGRGERHEAIDFPAKLGSPVYAVGAGRVIKSGFSEGHGNYIVIDHGNGYTTKYANNKLNKVRKGDLVRDRQKIAYVGNSGKDSTGPHLHFEVTHDGRVLDPQTLFIANP